ncbi:MAG: hypothetical protein H0X14_08740, partial [Acidobacteria bacterium]|nr:hypothetical protein [Acidobacteriota bacterium]
DFLQNPIVSPLVAALWFLCAALIALGRWSVLASLVNLLLCRYFFVRMRWKGILRGMGAPGFMAYWLAAAIFLLEYTLYYAPNLHSLALLVLQVDFAFIMLSAGIYKCTAGYRRNHGMEYGMVNPQWGYWGSFYKRLRPSHWLFRIFNHLAWTTEVVAGVLMLIPQTRFIGGMLILASFIFIATQIRLALLCEMVIVCCLIFFHPGSYGEQFLSGLVPAPTLATASTFAIAPITNMLLAGGLWAYLILLPLMHAALFYNFYGRKSLPRSLQRIVEIYTNFFGIIIWRVFSADHTCFFIRVYQRWRSVSDGARTLLSRYGLTGSLRYSHVGESIVVTTLFTTLKYYPSNTNLFQERLLRYARTVACPSDSVLEFEYVKINKAADQYEFSVVAEYVVDPIAGSVVERTLDDSFSVRAAHAASPVHEGVRPGSYVPLGR